MQFAVEQDAGVEPPSRKIVTRSNSSTTPRRAPLLITKARRERSASLNLKDATEALRPGVTLAYSSRPVRDVEVLGHHPHQRPEGDHVALPKFTMPPANKDPHLVTTTTSSKGGLPPPTSHASPPGLHHASGGSHHPKCKTWASCKRWCKKQRRCLVWVVLAFAVAITAVLWYHHVKHAQELARKKPKRWWSFY